MRRLLLVMMMVLTACAAPVDQAAGPGGDATAPPVQVDTAAPQASPGRGVPAALDWSVDRLGGGQINGGDLAGRDVVLWFWAPW